MDLKPYHHHIINAIPDGARVLDLGCGPGTLLEVLNQEKKVQVYGIDFQFDHVAACIKKGISAYHGDINDALEGFADDSFDIVILSQTLQQTKDPVFLLNEMLRVGKKGIVTFPNFGYWRLRLNLFFAGGAPKSKSLPYEWYDTPNIRVLSIHDFKNLCRKEGIHIEKEIDLHSSLLGLGGQWMSNLMSQQGIFILQKG